jgi:ribose transport system permease protein
MSTTLDTGKPGLLRALFRFLVINSILPVLLVVLYVGFGLREPHFFSFGNLVNILRQSSYLVMLAAAQMIVLLTRGFDLSVGNVVSMVSVASAMVMVAILKKDPGAVSQAILLGCLCGIAIGLLVGSVNGAAVSIFRVNPFVATLGMLGISLGLATTISNGFPVFDVPMAFMTDFSKAAWLGVPVPIAVCLTMLGVMYFVFNYTVFGRSLYLLGSNPRAAYVAGVPTRVYLFLAYVLCSLLVAIVALMLTARTGSGEPNLGGGLMMNSLMAAVIGGVSLQGGEGRLMHCVLGSLFVTVLSNGMNMIRIDSYLQMMVLGAVLILAIFIDRLRARIR